MKIIISCVVMPCSLVEFSIVQQGKLLQTFY